MPGVTLSPAALDRLTAAHIFRRARFGAPASEVSAAIGRSAVEVVEEIIDAALSAPAPGPPPWKDEPPPPRTASPEEREAYADLNRQRLLELVTEWMKLMQTHGLRERMTLFWHNHFVTSVQTYQHAQIACRYLDLLRRHALGNFRDFVRAIGLDAAMLIYLNGAQNRAGAPNENFARELLELFTMGISGPTGAANYVDSEDPPGDVQEIARALTGWVVDPATFSGTFVRSRFDGSEKTIFGRTGTFGYDDVIDLIFEERPIEVAHFVCRKLYQEFVCDEPDEPFVASLADQFVAADFEIAPVVRSILNSDAFYDGRIVGSRIKSPVEALLGLIVAAEVDSGPGGLVIINRFLGLLSQSLLDPPNVAGWPGHRAWIDTTTLPLRWVGSDVLVSGRGEISGADVVSMAEALTDPAWDSGGRWLSPFFLPVAVAEHLLAIPLENASIDVVTEEFAGDLDTYPIPEEVRASPSHVQNLVKIFLAGAPWYEWNLYADGADVLLQSFVRYLAKLPEYQLT